MAFIQWNCRSFNNQLEEIKLLTRDYKPICLSLQETFFKDSSQPKLNGYTFYRKDDISGDRARGGVALVLSNDFYSEEIAINTTLQAVAARVSLPQPITLCSIYLPPPPFTVSALKLSDLISQLQAPFVVMGDFNAHNALWGSKVTDKRGEVVEDELDANNLVLLNNGDPTHFTTHSGEHSAIDLTLCSAAFSQHTVWEVHPDLCGSDHFPIMISLLNAFDSPQRIPRWNFARADWSHFRDMCHLTDLSYTDAQSHVKVFTDIILQAANASIPTTSTKPRRIPVPWWNDACHEALKKRRRALKIFSQYSTQTNLESFRRLRAKAKYVIKQAKKASWKQYISSITYLTPASQVWEKVRRISGKRSSYVISGIESNNSILTSFPDIANAFGTHYEAVSSSEHYSASFLRKKAVAEKHRLNFSSSNEESYNAPFSKWELTSVIRHLKDSSPGGDRIHNKMLKQLPDSAIDPLLQMMNRFWSEDLFPDTWREAIIIPILKPGKDKKLPISYRPISLTNCLCKVMERIVNRRLMWWLETNNRLCSEQSGYRRNHSTVDHLVRLETFLQQTFVKGWHAIAVFFDLEKAYDTTWRYNILKTLFNWGIRGHLGYFILNFLTNRRFRVRIGNVLSDFYNQDNGLPQGSVISTTCFLVAINAITNCIKAPVYSSLYVDDLAIFCRGLRQHFVERQIQGCVKRLVAFADDTGFKFSPAKCNVTHFTRKQGVFPRPAIAFHKTTLPTLDVSRFLGLYFDSKLSWRPHIAALRAKCMKAMNILRALSGTSWGADRESMLRLYRALIRSKLDYGSIVYNSARKSYLKPLNTVHNAGIRLATGALRTSRVESLLCEASEPSLDERRKYLTFGYMSKLRSMPGHSTHHASFLDNFQHLFDAKANPTIPTGIRFLREVECLNFDFPVTFPTGHSASPPWLVPQPIVHTQLTIHPKISTSPAVYKQNFLQLVSTKKHFSLIFTDGSKMDAGVGCSFTTGPSTACSLKLDPLSSIYTAELVAIQEALRYVENNDMVNALICSDSLSALEAISNLYPSHPLVQQVQTQLATLRDLSIRVEFCWVPGHVGIVGNELADTEAKSAVCRDQQDLFYVPIPDLKAHYKSLKNARWERTWHDTVDNKLRAVKPTVAPWSSSVRRCRREEVVLCRLRIGHSLFTNGYLFTIDKQQPICETCHVAVTISHILTTCDKYRSLRDSFKLRGNLSQILSNDSKILKNVFEFLKAALIYNKI